MYGIQNQTLLSTILNLKIFVQVNFKMRILKDAFLGHAYIVIRRYSENRKRQAIII